MGTVGNIPTDADCWYICCQCWNCICAAIDADGMYMPRLGPPYIMAA